MKRCNKCLEYFPTNTDYFHRHKRMEDGFQSYCKVCMKEDRQKADDEITVRRRVPHFRTGQEIEIRGDGRRTIGKIVGKYNYHLVVNNGRYDESYTFADIYSGQLLVRVVG